MAVHGICLRPAADFEWAGVKIPDSLTIKFFIPQSENDIIESGRDAQFIIAPSHSTLIGETVFANLPNLRVVQVTGAGYDKVDLEAAAKYKIPVAHAPGQNSRSVAQYVFIMIGAILRRLFEASNMVKENKFAEARKKLTTPTLHEFGEQNLAVIGIGEIGREVARIGRFFGYEIGYFDINKLPPEVEEKLGVQFYDFPDILSWADVISLHVPLMASTRLLIGEKELNAMKSTAILINISRGGIVDENALYDALKNETIWGAGIDVFDKEPPPGDHPFFQLKTEVKDRLVLSPHMGGRTQEANRRMFSFALENVRAYLLDKKPLTCVVASNTTGQEV